ncbi:MAG: YeeE/YedE family protein [Beijerinckiaceae bacterium]|jgi:uncharacterized protein|nr:YeeE/YedE family protein [Beijerinckiaceae bacterium]
MTQSAPQFPHGEIHPSRGEKTVLLKALGLVAAGCAAVALTVSVPQSLLYLTGAALGLTLYHASFGFTSSYRVLMADGRSAGIRAQMVMLALVCLLFYPVLAAGTLFGSPVSGFVAPAGTSVVVGAFVFGIGMQLGGACASGTLFTAGGGNVRMCLTLLFFIAGSVFGLEHLPWWEAQPSLPAISMVTALGWPGALAANLAIFAAIWIGVSQIERKRHGKLETIWTHQAASSLPKGFYTLLRGPWPIAAGALALAILNFATLYQAGRPWGITSAFPLWGAKVMALLGVDMGQWQSWSSASQQNALAAPVLADITSAMNFGIILGAMAAAILARRFNPSWRVPPGQIAASVIGGLMLGYGARLAYGCNIGAFFSGLASGSLHGWLWILCAIPGNLAGMYLRPLFGMQVEWRKSAC